MAQRDAEAALDAEAIKRILSAARGQHDINIATIELAAGVYVDLKKRSANSTGRGLKADLRLVRNRCRAAAEALDNLPLSVDLTLLIVRGLNLDGEGGAPQLKHKDLAMQLRQLAKSIDTLLVSVSGRLPRLDMTMRLTLILLEVGYFHGTGRPATHTSNKDGEHVGEPLSEFGRYVVAFFREVDPAMTLTSLNTELRKFVHSRDYQSSR